jgi:hypothetical protein
LTDVYARFAAVLWFLPVTQLESVLQLAEELTVEHLRSSLEGGADF